MPTSKVRWTMLIISGPPGAGKSTVAATLAAHSPMAACVEADWFWTTIVSGFVAPWLPDADAQNRAVLRSALLAAQALEHSGYETVIDGILGPWMLDVVADAFQDCHDVDYVVLRPSLAICLRQACERPAVARVPGHPPLSDSGPIRHMWHQFADLGDHEHHVIDTSELSEHETVDAVLEARRNGHLSLELHGDSRPS